MPVQKSGDKRKRSTAETDGTYVCQCHSNFKNVTYVIAHFEFILYHCVICTSIGKACKNLWYVQISVGSTNYSGCTINIPCI